jgi:hypothetical protein
MHALSFNVAGLKSPFHLLYPKKIFKKYKNPVLLLPNQMFRQPKIIREGLADYFIGRGLCQGLIPFNQVLWPDSDDFNEAHEFMKPETREFLHSKKMV